MKHQTLKVLACCSLCTEHCDKDKRNNYFLDKTKTFNRYLPGMVLLESPRMDFEELRIGPPADWPQPADDGYEQLDIDMTLGLPPSNSLLDFYPAQSNLSIK